MWYPCNHWEDICTKHFIELRTEDGMSMSCNVCEMYVELEEIRYAE